MFKLLFLVISGFSGCHMAKVDNGLLGKDLPGCKFSESLKNENFSADSGCIIVNKKGEILLTINSENHKFDIPGGTSEKNETSKFTAYRETLEEIGIEVEVQKLIFKATDKDGKTNALYFCKPLSPVDLNFRDENGEQIGIQWVKLDTIKKENMRPEFAPFFDKVEKILKENLKKI